MAFTDDGGVPSRQAQFFVQIWHALIIDLRLWQSEALVSYYIPTALNYFIKISLTNILKEVHRIREAKICAWLTK